MGITKLADLIRFHAPDAISHKEISDFTGKVIALDTSIVVNQFRAATPTLSPLTGLFFRTLTFLEHDIKPVFVFDGKPPEEKTAALEKRAEAASWKCPNLTGTASSQTKDCLHLLKLLGVPFIQAPGDAEALCAQLVREGTADAVASEDMDTLPFGANILIRQLNAKRDSEVVEYSLPKLLEKLQISQEEFVDLCILLGCDYCDKITGLGPKKALTLIQKHRTIENVVLHINRQTHPVPHFWKYKEARKIFLDAPQTVDPKLIWTEPDEEALVGFLCHVKYVKVERVRRRMERFRQTRESKREERERDKAAGRSRQTRMEDFFRVTRKREQPVEAADSSSSNRKRPKST
ncbi:putative flap endonuclease 1 -like [Scophthalmus maximus]|uniref:Putative flap endonuclease 1-like n=1 Tax=Scophthalmus maximus TaxID=52904 RepID=A0A2U9BKR8_SCOMX|nr:probable flap endonuclease 1 homolog isoform X2 [Scophthalmus maximus]AWP04360.1 putative flap endonuclease 1 -like [Scophthalmus maximus]